jgi:hypothetical protein
MTQRTVKMIATTQLEGPNGIFPIVYTLLSDGTVLEYDTDADVWTKLQHAVTIADAMDTAGTNEVLGNKPGKRAGKPNNSKYLYGGIYGTSGSLAARTPQIIPTPVIAPILSWKFNSSDE